MKFVMHLCTDGCGVCVVEKHPSGVSTGQAGIQKEPKVPTLGRQKTWIVLALQGWGRGDPLLSAHDCAETLTRIINLFLCPLHMNSSKTHSPHRPWRPSLTKVHAASYTSGKEDPGAPSENSSRSSVPTRTRWYKPRVLANSTDKEVNTRDGSVTSSHDKLNWNEPCHSWVSPSGISKK